MPEGDTVCRVAGQLRQVLDGRHVTTVAGSDQLPGADVLQGCVVTAIESRGKHLLIHSDGNTVVHSHLGMQGAWHVYRLQQSWKKPQSQAALALTTERHCVVCFRPKTIELLTGQQLRRHVWLNRLGPDLLGPPFDRQHVIDRFRRRNADPVGDVVMDQSVVCGIGNVYKSEILFLEGINPLDSVSDLSDEQLMAVTDAAVRLLRRNLTGKNRRTRFRPTGPSVWVYGRSGELCLKCGAAVRMVRQGGLARSTYFCPQCQPTSCPSAAAG